MSDVNLKSYSDTSYHNEELKSLTRYRFDKVKERAKLKSSVSRLVCILFPELEKLVPTLHMASVYALLSEFPSALAIASAHLTRLTNLLCESSKGRYGKEAAITFRESARNSIGSNIMEFMKGDPEGYGEFFSQPVLVTTEEVYPIPNYGSAMTPFYTILAIWVGGTILVALIKVKAEPKNLKNVKSYQLFFGRYLLFFVMGQLQALIIVLGDIYILHCQILYPGWFWLVASLASVTFTLLIYSLALSFGDVGKALAVVIMVIQIAGSGGTFPIELLPAVYRNIYIFFPFPYAINAMRETIGGMYGSDYMKNLAELMIFAVVGLLIGLVIRIPFVKLNHFVEKRMEDTKMM